MSGWGPQWLTNRRQPFCLSYTATKSEKQYKKILFAIYKLHYVMQDKGGRRRRGGLPFCCLNGFCDYVLCHYCCAIKGAKTQVANLVASFLVATVMHGCLFAHIYLQCFRGRCGGHPGLSIKVTTQLKTSVNSWEHRKTSKIIWYRPENKWGPCINNLVQFEEGFSSQTKKSVGMVISDQINS